MPHLSVFTVFVTLEQYRRPYVNHIASEYQYFLCWLTWIMLRFGFRFEAVDWDCGYRQVTSMLPPSAFLVPGCTFLYTFYNKVFKLTFRRMDQTVHISFSEQSDQHPSTFIMPNASVAREGILGQIDTQYLPGLHTYLQRVVDRVFNEPAHSFENTVTSTSHSSAPER